jgi:tRNA U34 2-thiouridine synthase MnmA/TrmU
MRHVKLIKIMFDVKLEQNARDITPGQIAVMYHGDIVLGSGKITPVKSGGSL